MYFITMEFDRGAIMTIMMQTVFFFDWNEFMEFYRKAFMTIMMQTVFFFYWNEFFFVFLDWLIRYRLISSIKHFWLFFSFLTVNHQSYLTIYLIYLSWSAFIYSDSFFHHLPPVKSEFLLTIRLKNIFFLLNSLRNWKHYLW